MSTRSGLDVSYRKIGAIVIVVVVVLLALATYSTVFAPQVRALANGLTFSQPGEITGLSYVSEGDDVAVLATVENTGNSEGEWFVRVSALSEDGGTELGMVPKIQVRGGPRTAVAGQDIGVTIEGGGMKHFLMKNSDFEYDPGPALEGTIVGNDEVYDWEMSDISCGFRVDLYRVCETEEIENGECQGEGTPYGEIVSSKSTALEQEDIPDGASCPEGLMD